MIKKYLFILSIFSFIYPCFSQFSPISIDYRDKIVKSIYIIEGKNKTKYPFGIKSIETNGNYEKSKRICEKTVENNWIRWQKLGKTNDFIEFLGNRYCPQSADKQGNINWIKNLKYYLNKEKR
ncbi:MAG: hypothetical protein Q7R95_11400 [bacterium]|nr:hypothetical protein [bacterium]